MDKQRVLMPENRAVKKWRQKVGIAIGITIVLIIAGFYLVPEKKTKNLIGHYYFYRYIVSRSSPVADKLAQKAFITWSRSGNLTSLESASKKIVPETPLWRDFIWIAEGGYRQRGRYEQFGPFLHRLEKKVTSRTGKMTLYLKLGEFYRLQEKKNAVGYFQNVLEIDADPVLAAQARGNLHDIYSLNIGQEAPVFVLEDMNGEIYSNSSTQGKVVVLLFWNVDCPGCLEEMKFYKKIFSQHRSDFLVVLGISLKVGDKTHRYVVREKLKWPQVILNEEEYHEIQQSFNIQYVPNNYVIDPDGKIAAKHLVPEEFEPTIKELVETSSRLTSNND